ncbi:MAG: hypothetical protein AVDCRST_MAG80-649, partial [uncultured Rubrobacteraceae bacterium]
GRQAEKAGRAVPRRARRAERRAPAGSRRDVARGRQRGYPGEPGGLRQRFLRGLDGGRGRRAGHDERPEQQL